ncbi:MAG: hypothetical protein PHD48_05570 [Alphaproteobacteria bacterium]|nr:hypothetical protein [Alphaproteobacteria bacterium]
MRLLYAFFQQSPVVSCRAWGPMRLLVVLACLVMLSGCGKRPAKIDPLSSDASVVYPRVYPDLATDPAP